MFKSFRFPTKQQNFIWLKQRQKVKPSILAEQLNVSRPFISKSQRIAKMRINKLLQHTAAVNRIQVAQISPEHGLLIGYCPSTQSMAYIIYSPTLGVQIWLKHRGECAKCESYEACQQTIKQLSKEWQIPLQHDLSPSDNALILFTKMQEVLGWKGKR